MLHNRLAATNLTCASPATRTRPYRCFSLSTSSKICDAPSSRLRGHSLGTAGVIHMPAVFIIRLPSIRLNVVMSPKEGPSSVLCDATGAAFRVLLASSPFSSETLPLCSIIKCKTCVSRNTDKNNLLFLFNSTYASTLGIPVINQDVCLSDLLDTHSRESESYTLLVLSSL